MSAHPLDVNIRSTTDDEPGRYRIQVDGRDISNVVHAAHIDITARDIPEVTIDLIPRQVIAALTGANVQLDHDTRALLEALGWTPPRGE